MAVGLRLLIARLGVESLLWERAGWLRLRGLDGCEDGL